MTVAVVNLKRGNLQSVVWALERLGLDVVVTEDPEVVAQAGGVVLPGVGHFAAAARALSATGMDQAIWNRVGAVPLLGICLGMQLLFESSEEGGRGLGVLPGTVTRLQVGSAPLPHVGWNQVHPTAAAGWMREAGAGDAYFCHAFAVKPQDQLVATAVTDYHGGFVSAVQRGLVAGVQFHPERSGAYGRRVLTAFAQQVMRCSA
jgi:glutamine amidotransferase